MARTDFAASVKSYARPPRLSSTRVCVCVRARVDTKERLGVCARDDTRRYRARGRLIFQSA